MEKKFWSNAIQDIEPYKPGEQPQDQQYIKLNTNENPYPPPENILEVVQQALTRINLYPDPEATEMRNAVSRYYERIKPDNVFVGNGSDEVLAIAFQAFFNSKELVYPDITYSFYPVYAAMYGAKATKIPLDDQLQINVEDYLSINKAIILANPNAPTTLTLQLEEIERLVKTNPNNVVVIDEAYVDFGGDTAIYLTKEYRNLLVVQTLSKSRSLAGNRIGFAVGSDELIAAMNAVKNSFNSYTIDTIANLTGAYMMDSKDWFNYTVGKIIHTRERIAQELIKLEFNVLPSSTNFLFVTHNVLNGEEIYNRLKEKGILIRYFSKPKRIANYVRITIGTDEEMDALIEQLKLLLAE